MVEEGLSIPIPDFPKNPCIRLAAEELPLFDLGFDGGCSAQQELVASVREDSEAFKAGVRESRRFWVCRSTGTMSTSRSGSRFVPPAVVYELSTSQRERP